jgi:hypothetical protein
MLWRASRRSSSLVRYLVIAFFIWTAIDAAFVYHALSAAARGFPAQGVLRKPARVFIASIHWNNEYVLRNFWNKGVLDLARTFGPDNVFVSIFESGSWDNSKAALRELDDALGVLGVQRKVILDDTTHEDEIAHPPPDPKPGWVRTQRGRIELRRIPYLSRLRNKSLEPLVELAENGTEFDYVLFLNDVVFSVRFCFTSGCCSS